MQQIIINVIQRHAKERATTMAVAFAKAVGLLK